ncbi:ComQ [Lysinibacillus contaminans]|uniref:ComQ n=1 Tax=Lysinibacillus contaminans TaxID=1293441 RepID=A0ABR5JX85_9BACI|nr:class 1 isoprenoid biosynthesis enzyme [Lysinibacillus contaminans]KOS66796.1 ComQ [Lysinibacillus contaminans]
MEITSQQNIISCASRWIQDSFYNEHLQQLALEYIDYKFKLPLSLSNLTEIHYQIFRTEYTNCELVDLQTIIEIILLASDILDDIQDQDSPTSPWSNEKLNHNLNVLIGLLFISLSKINTLQCSNQTKIYINNNLYPLMLDALNGQHEDLENKLSNEVEYIKLATLKSGSLIFMANLLGAGEISTDNLNKVKEYSGYLGVIAQIRNDVHDLVNLENKKDLKKKKKTLPILYYLHNQDERFKVIKGYYEEITQFEELTKRERNILKNAITNGGALTYCKIVEQIYLSKFKECIDSMELSQHHKNLLITINI